jgi:hypothetical protein
VRSRGGAAGSEAADQEKPQVYSWAYSEEIFGPGEAQMAEDLDEKSSGMSKGRNR